MPSPSALPSSGCRYSAKKALMDQEELGVTQGSPWVWETSNCSADGGERTTLHAGNVLLLVKFVY